MVEDSHTLATLYTSYLSDEQYTLIVKDTGQGALDYLKTGVPTLILLDLNLPDMDGMKILQLVHQQQMPSSVVIMTAHGSIDIAVDAMRYGAFDFLEKPFNAKRLIVTLRNALERHNLTNLVLTLQEIDHYYGFIGSSLEMQAVYRIIDSAASSRATVFITGESGTGKEVCADAIHRRSNRRNKPFIALNCGAIPADLLESEIFGHVKGAFTGAITERKGLASQADGGTFFLDEICEMNLDLQVKLLRFIQTNTYQKIGSEKLETVDIRIICATNRDPWQEVQLGRFREDLFYRLHVIPVTLPPLRERGGDILLIARHFLGKYSQEEGKSFQAFDKKTEALLLNYAWPGNVRQLMNVLRNIVVLNNCEVVTPDLLPKMLETVQIQYASSPLGEPNVAGQPVEERENSIIPLWQSEKRIIEEAIDYCSGNIPKAANLLEVSPSTIYRKLQSWESHNFIKK